MVSFVFKTATFASKCVCGGGCPPGENGSEENKRPSTGSILLIVYVFKLVCYVISTDVYINFAE